MVDAAAADAPLQSSHCSVGMELGNMVDHLGRDTAQRTP